MRLQRWPIPRGVAYSSGSALDRARWVRSPVASPYRGRPFRSIFASSRKRGSCASAAKARATTTASTATASPSYATTSSSSGTRPWPPSKRQPRKEKAMNQQTTDVVIEKSVHVAAPVETAFRVFTDEIHTWWPLRTHAVDTDHSETVILEGREGGRLFERTPAGEEHLWGEVLAWEPPLTLTFSWPPAALKKPGKRWRCTSRRASTRRSSSSSTAAGNSWSAPADRSRSTSKPAGTKRSRSTWKPYEGPEVRS